MGIRSDLAIAVKTVHVEKFLELSKELDYNLETEAETFKRSEEGVLIILEQVKVYHPDIEKLLGYLRENVPSEDYKVVEACAEYPESDDANAGEWDDNPWGFYKAVSVSIGILND